MGHFGLHSDRGRDCVGAGRLHGGGRACGIFRGFRNLGELHQKPAAVAATRVIGPRGGPRLEDGAARRAEEVTGVHGRGVVCDLYFGKSYIMYKTRQTREN